MNLILIITIVCYTHYANSLSLEFTATESPNGVLNLGERKVSAICDPTRECKLDTQSRSQCNRLGCCWHPTSKKCVSKKYFISDSVAPIVVTYKLVTEELKWEAANDYCSKNFGGSLVMTGVDTNQGRIDICNKVNSDTGVWIGVKRDNTAAPWHKVDGEPAPSDFEFTWLPGYQGLYYYHMQMNCGLSNGGIFRGNVMNQMNFSYKFICQY